MTRLDRWMRAVAAHLDKRGTHDQERCATCRRLERERDALCEAMA